MFQQALALVFANAAAPQKVILFALAGAIPVTFVAAALALQADAHACRWRRLVSDLRLAGPALGLLVGAMNSFHMAQTIQRVPFASTAKQLAPAILEVSTLVGLGALVGIVATAAHFTLGLAAARNRTS